jgi:hypothetical protein
MASTGVGFSGAVDAQREAREARTAWVNSIQDAWRSPSSHPMEAPRRPTSFADATAMRRSAYQQYCARLRDAWRNPPNPNASSHQPGVTETSRSLRRDAAEPDAGTMRFSQVSPEQFVAARNGQPDYEAIRRQANADYVERTMNAWRNPGNPAAAANTVEALRRGWTHESGR